MPAKNLSRPKAKIAESSADAGHIELDYYYDNHPTKEDLMAESPAQSELVDYLKAVLKWQYDQENWYVVSNIGIYQTLDLLEYPIAPDLAVFIGTVVTKEERHGLRSWKTLRDNRPAPSVVFEISSKDTWPEDLNLKPEQYRQMGVKEYFAYDPNVPTFWTERRKRTEVRLRGWSYEAGRTIELAANEQGWLWSKALNSWLVPDTEMLRLYDSDKQLRLTKAEAEEAAKIVEQAAKEAERTAKEAERTAKERAWAKLRELGVDPESL